VFAKQLQDNAVRVAGLVAVGRALFEAQWTDQDAAAGL